MNYTNFIAVRRLSFLLDSLLLLLSWRHFNSIFQSSELTQTTERLSLFPRKLCRAAHLMMEFSSSRMAAFARWILNCTMKFSRRHKNARWSLSAGWKWWKRIAKEKINWKRWDNESMDSAVRFRAFSCFPSSTNDRTAALAEKFMNFLSLCWGSGDITINFTHFHPPQLLNLAHDIFQFCLTKFTLPLGSICNYATIRSISDAILSCCKIMCCVFVRAPSRHHGSNDEDVLRWVIATLLRLSNCRARTTSAPRSEMRKNWAIKALAGSVAWFFHEFHPHSLSLSSAVVSFNMLMWRIFLY